MDLRTLLIALSLLSGCAVFSEKIVTMDSYKAAIARHLAMRLDAPREEYPTFDCTFLLSQDEKGVIKASSIEVCDSPAKLVSIFEEAIESASPLPLPDNLELFDESLRFRFCRECGYDPDGQEGL